MTQQQGFRIPRLPVLLICIIAILWWSGLFSPTADSYDELSTQQIRQSDPDDNIQIDVLNRDPTKGTIQRLIIDEHEVIYQLHPDVAPQAILIIAHGCGHSAGDFWRRSEACPECLGLPEELRITAIALSKGWVPLTISSANRRQRCWDSRPEVTESADLPSIPRIVKAVVKREGLVGLPIYAFGASSGGALVLMLPHIMPQIKGICAQIMGIDPSAFQIRGAKYPPTVFIHMPKDKSTAALIADDMTALSLTGVKTIEIQLHPQPVTGDLLMGRCDAIDGSVSEVIIKTLKESNMLDNNGMLKSNPRKDNGWRGKLDEGLGKLVNSISLNEDESPVLELLNVAWGGHEISSESLDPVLEWLATGGHLSIKKLMAGCLETEEKDCM